jgi:tetratricopeptide (TPR) repeat protein
MTCNESGGKAEEPVGIRLTVFFLVAWFVAWFFVTWFFATSAIATPAPLGPAIAVSQDAKSDVRGHITEDADARLASAEADIDANKFDETESRLNAYLKDHPDSSRAYYDLGYVQFRTHNIGPSIKDLSKALELNPKNAEAHKVLALSCSIIGRYDLAEVELMEAARLKPGSAEIHYFLARTYYTRAVYPLAKTEFETAIRLNPSYIKAYSNLGITMEALGNTDAALKNYTTAIELEDRRKQKSEWPYIYLSAFYNRQKNAAEALAYARKAVEINSASDTAYFEMAKAYRTQKQLQKAVDAARSAIAINPQFPDYYYVVGLVLRELGNQQESEEALAKYAKLQQHSNAAPTSAVSEHKTQEPLSAPELQ